MVLDEIARHFSQEPWRTKFGTEHLAAISAGVVLIKPMEFMNDSGPPLNATARYYRVPPERILVISDDLDLPLGKLRMRPHGGHGGHNGLRSIIESMGSLFPRLRIGIGRQAGSDDAVISRVLGNFTAAEQPDLKRIIAAAAEGAMLWRDKGVDPAMRFLNTWQLTPPPAPVKIDVQKADF